MKPHALPRKDEELILELAEKYGTTKTVVLIAIAITAAFAYIFLKKCKNQ